MKLKYTYTYRHSKCTLEILKENILYFELYKKTNFWQKKSIYTATKLLFLCSLKYNAVYNETSHDYSGHAYVFMK
jgi:hypothetical protein